MTRLLKRSLISLAIVLATLVFMCGGMLLVHLMQRNAQRNALQAFVENDSIIKNAVKGKEAITVIQPCRVGNEYGRCEAVLYAIDNEECLEIIRKMGSSKSTCNFMKAHVYDDHTIVVRLGSTYSHDGLHLALETKEKSLFWSVP